MHSYDSHIGGNKISPKDLVTSTADHHPIQNSSNTTKITTEVGFGSDGIYRNLTKNAFHAGPIKAPTNIRTTARFDYQPDICKDYKETGFCGYGDTCIYLHDRSDTISGWQLELQYEEQQKLLKKQQQEQLIKDFMNSHKTNNNNNNNNDRSSNDKSDTNNNNTLNTDDNIPFACYICRQSFTNPIVTKCNHYFCEGCIMQYGRDNSNTTAATQCPICNTDTGSIFNEPTKLMTKVKRLLGLSQRRSDNTISKESWDAYYAMANHTRK
jgi:RING finger protein 113A